MGDDRELARLHREEVRRQVRAGRRTGRPRGGEGRRAPFLRELGADVVRLLGVFGPPLRKRKEVT